jgi:protein-export membrane protein SecD
MGIAADIALIIYTLLYVIFLAIVPGVQLTLPGIAGILLSIGMAVDANIVIFERIKREFAGGKTIRSAVDAGFKRAVITVIDANVTTILAAIVLFFLTTGAIKGFAITLLIGVVLSMITSIFVTRGYLKVMMGLPKTESKAKFFNLKKEEAENA